MKIKNLEAFNALIDAKNQWPNHPAIHDEIGTMTFLELFTEVDFLKLQLTDRNIREGMSVGVMAKNGRGIIVGIFAVIGTGATVMPMSHQLKPAEISQNIELAGLNCILDDFSGHAPFQSEDLLQFKNGKFRFSAIHSSKNFAPHINHSAFMRFTSGTTGKAKGVIISHKSAVERIEAANRKLKLGTDDCVIWVLPIAYHFVVSILLYVRFGAAIAIAQDFLAESINLISKKHKGTLLYASPMQIRLLANAQENISFPNLKHVISTSAAIAPEVCEAFKAKFGIPVSQAYGIIEIGLPILNYEHSSDFPEAVGNALPDYEIAILNDKNEHLGVNEVGNLAIKGPGMFDGYLDPALTREEVLVNGYFLTADFASVTEDGLIVVHGRQLSMINVSGNKVYPEEVEGILEMVPEIKLARVSGVPHPLLGQIIQAEVILEEGTSIDVEKVLSFCRKQLSTFKIPQRILIVETLPMTGSGKIKRGE